MNPADEIKEKTNEDIKDDPDKREEKDDPDEKEEIDDPDELEKEKKSSEFTVKDNMAQYQIFIQNLDNLFAGYKQSPKETKEKQNVKKYDLRNTDDCSEFVEKYRDSEYVAVAVILSVFEVISIGDLPDLEEQLLEYLPIAEKPDDEAADARRTQRNPYISLNTILAVIGGEKFVAGDGRTYVCLEEDTKQALVNILELFPVLRRTIITWLIHLHEVYQYRTSFDAYQIMAAFARVISVDITDAKTQIFPKLYANPDNVGLLGNLAYRLYGEADVRKDMEDIIIHWVKSDSIWLWKSACLAYVFLMEDGNSISFGKGLNRAVRKRFYNMKRNDLNFLAVLLIQSKHFRSMLAEIIYGVFGDMDSREEKMYLAQRYIYLIRYGYYQVKPSARELPLVACDTKRQQECLIPVVRQVMLTYHLRKQLYAILRAYLEELSGYEFSADMINHIAAYFYNMAFEPSYLKDVLFFLQGCKNEAARQVYQRLYETYEKKRSVLLT